jgi:hypothetical protein
MSVEEWNRQTTHRKEEFTAAANSVIKTPYAFHARLELEFELMPQAIA